MKKTKINKKLIIGTVLLVSIAIIKFLIFPVYYSTIHPSRLFVNYQSESLTDNTLRFKCELGLDSINALKSYKYRIDGDKLYVTIKGGWVTSGHHSQIDIVITDDRISQITQVYAKGGGDTKLLLSVGDTIVNETLSTNFDPNHTVLEAIPVEEPPTVEVDVPNEKPNAISE
ncbi:MAG: hypothetical protein FWG83_07230 [Oscillospiraceae bacterium]|nr:hypothetical protein [Oscillospiraceae bacterium]